MLASFTVLWGIWFVRNKKVWEVKAAAAADTSMEWSKRMMADWQVVKAKKTSTVPGNKHSTNVSDYKWTALRQVRSK